MSWKRDGVSLAILAMLPILASQGCTGSEALNPSTGTFTLRAKSTGTASRLTAPDKFEEATIQVGQISFRPWPIDSQADKALGPDPLGMLHGTLSVDLASTNEIVAPPIPLNPGTYRITRISFQSIRFVDDDDTPPNPLCTPGDHVGCDATLPFPCLCTDLICEFTPGGVFDLDDPEPAFTFTVTAGGGDAITLTLNSKVFAQATETAFGELGICQVTASCDNPVAPAPCVNKSAVSSTKVKQLILQQSDILHFTQNQN